MEQESWMNSQLERLYELAQETNTQVREINGHVKRHQEEIFGIDNHPGLRQEVDEIHDYMIGTKSAVKTVVTVISLIGVANLVALALLITGISGGM